MPRDGATGQYTPPYLPVISGHTIESVPYNGNISDVAQDLNTARPIVAGGTGGTSAVTAMQNLNGEITKQVITNFDTNTLYSGSFTSATSATGAPVNGHAFAGIIYKDDTTTVIEARDITDPVPGIKYVRRKVGAGAWSAWMGDGSAGIDQPVTVPGPTTITGTNGGRLIINKPSGVYPQHASIYFSTNNVFRWRITSGSAYGESETTGDTGSDLCFWRSHDNGTELSTPSMLLDRSTGHVVIQNNCYAAAFLTTMPPIRAGEKGETIDLLELIRSLEARIETLETRLGTP